MLYNRDRTDVTNHLNVFSFILKCSWGKILNILMQLIKLNYFLGKNV